MAVAVESSRKVLVVDPDTQTRREIRGACEQDGYQVVEADAGSEALRQVEHLQLSLHLLTHRGLPICGQGFGLYTREPAKDIQVSVETQTGASDKLQETTQPKQAGSVTP